MPRLPSRNPFLRAVAAWDTEEVRKILRRSRGVIGSTDIRGRTCLHICAAPPVSRAAVPVGESIRTTKLLLQAGADVNAVELIREGEGVFEARPLWYAIAHGDNLELAKFLLAAGATANGCLWSAVWKDDPDMVRLLLEHGADVEEKVHQDTPLEYAIRLKRKKAIAVLEKWAAPTILPG